LYESVFITREDGKHVFVHKDNIPGGTFAVINFTTKSQSGTSSLNLSNVRAGSPEEVVLSLEVCNGNVTVILEPCDINRDGRINLLDLILIAQYWGKTGEPCLLPMDIDCDGVINILDMILFCHHWIGEKNSGDTWPPWGRDPHLWILFPSFFFHQAQHYLSFFYGKHTRFCSSALKATICEAILPGKLSI